MAKEEKELKQAGRIVFYEQIASNKRKSFFLLAIIFIVLILLGYVIGLTLGPDYFTIVMIIAIIISISYIWIGYYNSDKIALASVNAKPANPSEYRQLYNLVEGLTLASGMPMPKIYIMENQQINAFATGRDPQQSVICVTTGAIEKLNKQELEGVLAHELSHIANYDIRFMTLAAVLVGMIAIISQIFLRSLRFSGGSGGSGGSSREGKGNAIFLLLGIILAILAPIAVQLVQLAISRKREFTADASAVKFTRYPPGLTNALKKIKNESESKTTEEKMQVSKAVAPLFISDPFRKKLANLTSTHPPIEQRIAILERM